MAESYRLVRSEQKLTGQQLISNRDTPEVYIDMAKKDDGVREFSVRANIALEKEAIADLIQKPMGVPELSWQESQEALRSIGYPSRRILALARSPLVREQLPRVGPSATALANIMSHDVDTESRTANVPVFTYGEAQKYSAKQIYGIDDERRLLLMLKSVGLKPELAKKFGNLLFSLEQKTEKYIRQLEEITGSTSAGVEMQVAAMLNEAGGAPVSELISRYQYENFVGFPEQSWVGWEGLQAGSSELTVFIREEDVPDRLARAETNVSVGALLRDKEGKRRSGYLLHKKAGKEQQEELLTRRQVTFHTQSDRLVAYPEIVWRRTPEGERSFYFRSNPFLNHGDRLARPNSLAGVALIASTVGQEMGVDYEDELKAILRRAGRKVSWARSTSTEMKRVWPLVASYGEQEILAHPYFATIEDAFEYVDLEDQYEKS